jgi:hypothetical protein
MAQFFQLIDEKEWYYKLPSYAIHGHSCSSDSGPRVSSQAEPKKDIPMQPSQSKATQQSGRTTPLGTRNPNLGLANKTPSKTPLGSGTAKKRSHIDSMDDNKVAAGISLSQSPLNQSKKKHQAADASPANAGSKRFKNNASKGILQGRPILRDIINGSSQ